MQQIIDWVSEVSGNNHILINILKTLLILVAAVLIIKFGKYLITNFFDKRRPKSFGFDDKQSETIKSMLCSLLKYGVYIIAATVILVDVFNVKSLIAAAGVGGAALGLGLQSFLKDIVAGFFIVFENQYSVGDYVTLEGAMGIVESVELRVTKLRLFSGDLHVIPNGEIKKSTNHSRDFQTLYIYIPVGYDNDMDKVISTAEKACKDVSESEEMLMEPVRVLGINKLGRGYMELGVTTMVTPNNQWRIKRVINQALFEGFKKEDIRLATWELPEGE